MESDIDEFNDETFGDAEIGDWEIEHEKFVMEYDADKLPPSPHEIPKIWETTDLSDFWSAGDLDVSQSYDSVLNVVESVEKLVSENELEDPAILNASKHAPLPHSSQNNPIPPSAKPNDIWASPFPQSRTPIPTQNEFQPNNDTYLSSDIDSLVDQYKNDLSLGPSGISKLNLSPIGGEMKPPFTVLREMEKNDYRSKQPQSKPQPLLSMPITLPDQLRQALAFQSPLLQNLGMSLRGPQAHLLRSGLLSAPQQGFNHFSAPPPPPLISTGPASSNSTGLHLVKPLPMPPNPAFNSLKPQQSVSQMHNQMFRQQQQEQMMLRSASSFPPPPTLPQQGSRLPPAVAAQLTDIFAARMEADQPNPLSFDLHRGAWMTPQDQTLVFNCQFRSFSSGNAYVEDYYYAVKWLRTMTRLREAKLAAGVPPSQLKQPYAWIPAPVTSSHLLAPDHPHRIAMRCRFVIHLVRRKRRSAAAPALPAPPPEKDEKSTRPASAASTVMTNASGLHSTQLGRPTKSNINTQRIIVDLSVATAIDEEQKEHFKTEAEEVASMLKAPAGREVTLAGTTETEEAAALRNAQHRLVVKQRRRLSILARIERLYATVLSIDETNVSLARIFVRNEESRHLMGHRLILLKVLHRDLFIVNQVQPESTNSEQPEKSRHLAVEIFEVPKGIRLFPVILHYLFPEDRAFCVAEFVSKYMKIDLSVNGGIDQHSQWLYNSCREVIYKTVETTPDFPRFCLRIPFSSLDDPYSTSTLKELLNGQLDPNVLAMFHSSFGISLFYCLMEACLRNEGGESIILCSELFIYACRIVAVFKSNLLPLPLALERFPRVADFDPRLLMRRDLFVAFQNMSWSRCAEIFCRGAVRFAPTTSAPSSGAGAFSTTTSPSMIQQQQQHQHMYSRGLSLA